MNKNAIIGLSAAGGVVVVIAIVVGVLFAVHGSNSGKESSNQTAGSSQQAPAKLEAKNACDLLTKDLVSKSLGVSMKIDDKFYKMNPKYKGGNPVASSEEKQSECDYVASDDVIPSAHLKISSPINESSKASIKQAYDTTKKTNESLDGFEQLNYGEDSYWTFGSLYALKDGYEYQIFVSGIANDNKETKALADAKKIADVILK